MDEGDTVHMIFKVVQQDNRTKYDTYKRENIPIFDSVTDLRAFLHSKIVILILRKKILVSSKKLLETSKIILVSIVRILF